MEKKKLREIPWRKDKKLSDAEWVDELRKAIAWQLEDGSGWVHTFFLNTNIPDAYRGSGDRSFGFLFDTTILKALGVDGIRLLHEMYPADTVEQAAAVRVVFGKDLPDVSPDMAKEFARINFVRSCEDTVLKLDAHMRYEKDSIMQHTLTSLKSELAWAVKEYGSKKEKQDGERE